MTQNLVWVILRYLPAEKGRNGDRRDKKSKKQNRIKEKKNDKEKQNIYIYYRQRERERESDIINQLCRKILKNIFMAQLGFELTTSATPPSTALSVTSTDCAIETTPKKTVRIALI